MKTIITMVLSAMVAVSAFAGGKETTTKYTVNAGESQIKWVGKKVTGQHTGNISFKEGEVALDGDKITSLSTVVDMTSMTCTDLQGEYGDKLIGHLKSDDFFGVEKYNTASFSMTKATPSGKGDNTYTISGNLTIKGKSNPATFPAQVVVKGNSVIIRADISFDRTKYDIKYGSGSFFDNLGDKSIDDEVLLSLVIVAQK